jgi:hypothetical protein
MAVAPTGLSNPESRRDGGLVPTAHPVCRPWARGGCGGRAALRGWPDRPGPLLDGAVTRGAEIASRHGVRPPLPFARPRC